MHVGEFQDALNIREWYYTTRHVNLVFPGYPGPCRWPSSAAVRAARAETEASILLVPRAHGATRRVDSKAKRAALADGEAPKDGETLIPNKAEAISSGGRRERKQLARRVVLYFTVGDLVRWVCLRKRKPH